MDSFKIDLIRKREKQSLRCSVLFDLAQAGGKSRTDPNGTLYKHLKQDSSLISNMEDKGLLHHVTDSTFIGTSISAVHDFC